MLWLTKLTLFSLVLKAFGSIQWLKNTTWIGIVVTGLFFSTYTITVTLSCGPRGDSDATSYVNGLDRAQCSSATGANAIMSILTSVVDAISNMCLLVLTYPLLPSLNLQTKQSRGIYALYFLGTM
jgi:hypothetical protein